TTYEYDSDNRVIKTTNPNGDETHNIYDFSTNLLLETYLTHGDSGPKFNHQRFEYDFGNPVRTYNVSNDGTEILVSQNDYNSDGRLKSTTSAGPSANVPGLTRYFGYDENGNQIYTWNNWIDLNGQLANVTVVTHTI